jgi:hypothetical protein
MKPVAPVLVISVLDQDSNGSVIPIGNPYPGRPKQFPKKEEMKKYVEELEAFGP